MYAVTIWKSLYDIYSHNSLTLSFGELAEMLTKHGVHFRKDDAPLFSAYHPVVHEPGCTNPQHQVGPHRCDACVTALSCAVFDADQAKADEDRLNECRLRLQKGDLAQIWFSTYSHRPDNQAHRLVIPFATPVPAALWPTVRANLIESYAIPADPKTSSSLQQAYYLPSRAPDGPAGETLVAEGLPLQWNLFTSTTRTPVKPAVALADWDLPPEPAEPPNIKPFLARLRTRKHNMKDTRPEKAEWLRRAIAGVALADHGQRNAATLVTTGVIAWALPDASLGTLCRIMAPSVDAMIKEGSKITHEKVRQMLIRAMRHRAEAEEDSRQAFRSLISNVMAKGASRGLIHK